MVDSLLIYLWQAVSATLIQILTLLGPGLLLTLILNFETRFVQNRAVSTLGRGWYLGLFGWLGTILHELGHAIFCLIFTHKITEMKLFDPDPQNGTLGYVRHSYNRNNIYQVAGNFFIGIGPIVLGTAVVFLLTYWLIGLNPLTMSGNFSSASFKLDSWPAAADLFQSLWKSSGHLFIELFTWQHISSWQLYIFIYLVFAIGSSITLSLSDIKAALGGFVVIVILMFILNLATLWTGSFVSNTVIGLAGFYSLFFALVFLIILVNIAVALFILFPLSKLRSKRSN